MEDAEQEQGYRNLAPVGRHDVKALGEPVVFGGFHLLERRQFTRMPPGAIVCADGGHDCVEGRASLNGQSLNRLEGFIGMDTYHS